MSPKRLLSTTITDQLKLATKSSKVIAVSLKDRGAILPSGHMADAAYWYDNKTGNFISSSYYLKTLPEWVNEFNGRKLVDKYLSDDWKLARPESYYQINSPDETIYEKDVFKEGKTSFPHSFKNLNQTEKYVAFETTSFGNDIIQ
jgi:hypothetical protein